MKTMRDSLGEKAVPDDVHYGAHTARSAENFRLSGEPVPMEIVYAMVKLKIACAQANHGLEQLSDGKRKAIVAACQRILAGECDRQFALDVFQAGSGTSTHMNVNEVVAGLANEILGLQAGSPGAVHANDDVNLGQSTNSIFPSGIRIACLDLSAKLRDAMHELIAAFRGKAGEFADVLKSGRTHLRDAVPVTLGQEFGAYARALEKDVQRIDRARERLKELSVGGNAIGTGLNTRREFRPRVIREISELTAEVYEEARDGIEITQFLTDLADLSSSLRLLAVDMNKICNDLRLLSSGPNTGLGEIDLPPVEAGSSIMPGKINPSICEAVNMICMQAMGNDLVVAMACSAGQLELNTHMPVIGANLVKSLKILARGCATLAAQCVAGITAHREVCARYFETSAGLATVLNPRLGYDRVAELVKEALATRQTLRQLVLAKNLMSEPEFEALIRGSTGPNL